jgi:hypothetical protein
LFSKWKRKKKLKTVTQVSLPILIRQVIYDSMLTPTEGIAMAMGLPPISNEVVEMEERASEERLLKFSALLPFIDSHADIAAKIATAAYVLEDDNMDEVEAEELEGMTRLFRLVSLASSVSCVSTLISLGLIESKVVSHEQ